jgi:hypothetical protein
LQKFVNLYDDNGTDIIVPGTRIWMIARDPRPDDTTDIEVGQSITVLMDNGSKTVVLDYDDETNCDDAFEHFCEQLGAE